MVALILRDSLSQSQTTTLLHSLFKQANSLGLPRRVQQHFVLGILQALLAFRLPLTKPYCSGLEKGDKIVW